MDFKWLCRGLDPRQSLKFANYIQDKELHTAKTLKLINIVQKKE
jgi:hypothetical protein